MGFRSDVRDFFGAILGLVRPSSHGVSPSGRVVPLWVSSTSLAAEDHIIFYGFQKKTKVAKIIIITSFSMGFRSDVREFFGALLGLVRPSGPWCFPVREGGVFVGEQHLFSSRRQK